MLLRYRGAEYTTNNAQLNSVEEVIGQYRGATVTRRIVQNQPNRSATGLVYRGATVR